MATTNTERALQRPREGFKVPCRVSSSSNITLAGEQTVGSTALVSGDRCLVRSQTNTKENGCWEVRVGTWVRAYDFRNADYVRSGQAVVDGANTKLYSISFTGDFVAGTTAITMTEVTADASALYYSNDDVQTFTGTNTFLEIVSNGTPTGQLDFRDALCVKLPAYTNNAAAQTGITTDVDATLVYFSTANKMGYKGNSTDATTFYNVDDPTTESS